VAAMMSSFIARIEKSGPQIPHFALTKLEARLQELFFLCGKDP